MKKRVLLIQPPRLASQPGRMLFPRGLAQIGSFLRAHGWPVAIVPLNFAVVSGVTPFSVTRSILDSVLAEFRPDVVGISCQYTIGYPACIEILRAVKELRAEAVTVIGGPHVTFTDAETMANPVVDVVVRGEGEWTLAELLTALAEGRDLSGVRGITFRNGGVPVRTPDRPPGNLAELPPVDFGLLPAEFIQRCQIFGLIHRGCRYHCSFCAEAAFWGRQRSLPAERVVEEIRELAGRYGTRMLGIEDSSQWLESRDLADLIHGLRDVKHDLPSAFFINLTVERLTASKREIIRRLREAGVGSVWLGIENSSERVLAMMGKKRPWQQTLDMCRALREHGFFIKAEWMIGHPGDDPVEAADAFWKLDGLFREDLITSADFGVFVPLPGTKPWQEPERFGIEILHRNYGEYDEFSTIHPVCRLRDFPVEALADCAWRTEKMVFHHTQVLRPARLITAPLDARPVILDTPPDYAPGVPR